MNNTGRSSHYRYGKCLSDSCKLGGPGSQAQRISAHQDFVCQECGKPLHECPPPKNGPDPKVIAAAAAGALVVLGGAGFGAYKYFAASDEPATPPTPTPTITLTPAEVTDTVGKIIQIASVTTPADAMVLWTTSDDQIANVKNPGEVELISAGEVDIVCTLNDTVRAVSHIKIVDKAQPEPGKEVDTTGQQTAGTHCTVGCGTYSGPMSGGKPHGIGGTITVDRKYNIDLKDGSGNTVSIGPGDKIVDTKFNNGVLQQGQIIFGNGTRKYVSGLAERL